MKRGDGPSERGSQVTGGGFRRILVAVEEAEEAEPALELARRVGVPGHSEVRALHLCLRESFGGRFALEATSSASFVAEAAVFELRMAGLGASAQVCYALVGKAAEAITDAAVEWQADLVVLGAPRRGELAARLLGSITQRVLQLAPCPVLVASRRAVVEISDLEGQRGAA